MAECQGCAQWTTPHPASGAPLYIKFRQNIRRYTQMLHLLGHTNERSKLKSATHFLSLPFSKQLKGISPFPSAHFQRHRDT